MGLPEIVLPKSRVTYNPHEYQTHCTEFILEKPASSLFLDMGLGKSVITLTALVDLLHDRFEVSKVLVIAPLRVAKITWLDEVLKWEVQRKGPWLYIKRQIFTPSTEKMFPGW
jgi:SNF2 family DNA or RNA helicase